MLWNCMYNNYIKSPAESGRGNLKTYRIISEIFPYKKYYMLQH